MTGFFIVLDGPDGAGKTTQILRLADALRSPSRRLLVTSEPTKGPIGTYIHQHLAPETPPEVLAALFAADRREHLELEVEPALARGLDVVCDRYIPSSLAYQGERAEKLNRDFRRPDLTVILKLSPATAMARLVARGGADTWERERQAAAHAGYVRAAETLRAWGWNVVEVDAEGGQEDVAARIWTVIRFTFPLIGGAIARPQKGPSSASAVADVSECGNALDVEPGRQRGCWGHRRRGGR